MALKSLDGAFGIVVMLNVRRGEFDDAAIAPDGSFELMRGLIAEYMPVDVNDLAV